MIALALPLLKAFAVFLGGLVVGVGVCALLFVAVWRAGK